jgi:hypothetical protein
MTNKPKLIPALARLCFVHLLMAEAFGETNCAMHCTSVGAVATKRRGRSD